MTPDTRTTGETVGPIEARNPMKKNTNISTPAGTTGLACEPWGAGEIYAVAADWAQASSNVMSYGPDGWDGTQYQVADFRHNDRAALAAVIQEAMEMSGTWQEIDEDHVRDEANECEHGVYTGGSECCRCELKGILDDAVEIDDQTAERAEMAEMLEGHGDTFAGNHAEEAAQEWLDSDFDAAAAGEWCEIGVWSASTAAEFRDAELTPDQVKASAEKLIEESGSDNYTDGSPIYSVCNCDTNANEIIDAAKE